MAFDCDLNFKNIDCRKQPELYQVDRGEQGVLMVEPYALLALQKSGNRKGIVGKNLSIVFGLQRTR